jgi:hypothetical protein
VQLYSRAAVLVASIGHLVARPAHDAVERYVTKAVRPAGAPLPATDGGPPSPPLLPGRVQHAHSKCFAIESPLDEYAAMRGRGRQLRVEDGRG